MCRKKHFLKTKTTFIFDELTEKKKITSVTCTLYKGFSTTTARPLIGNRTGYNNSWAIFDFALYKNRKIFRFIQGMQMILGDPEVTANLYCNFAYPYWEGCVICSIYLR